MEGNKDRMGGHLGKKRPGMAVIIGMGNGSAGGGEPPSGVKAPSNPPTKPVSFPANGSTPAPAGMSKGGISVDRAHFRDQNQTCSNCSYFQSDPHPGKCGKGVAADYSVSDASTSSCDYWEGGGEIEEMEHQVEPNPSTGQSPSPLPYEPIKGGSQNAPPRR